jgi:hypothetical protein
MQIFALTLLIIFLFTSSEPTTTIEQNAFYTHRLNPTMLTFFFGTLVVSFIFTVFSMPSFVQKEKIDRDSLLMKQQLMDGYSLKVCFFINTICSTYLGVMKFSAFYEDNFLIGRSAFLRK